MEKLLLSEYLQAFQPSSYLSCCANEAPICPPGFASGFSPAKGTFQGSRENDEGNVVGTALEEDFPSYPFCKGLNNALDFFFPPSGIKMFGP